MSHLLGVPVTGYTVNQASYDLARLRLNGLIQRRPRSNTYDLTPEGQRVVVCYTKVHDRLLRPLIAADSPTAPDELRAAQATIDGHVRNAPNTHAWDTLPENSRLAQSLNNQGSLCRSRDFARERWPLRGRSGHPGAGDLTVRRWPRSMSSPHAMAIC